MTFNGSLNGGKRSHTFGGVAPVQASTCSGRNNPCGHPKECSCGWWAREQAALEAARVPAFSPFPSSPHEEWWPLVDAA